MQRIIINLYVALQFLLNNLSIVIITGPKQEPLGSAWWFSPVLFSQDKAPIWEQSGEKNWVNTNESKTKVGTKVLPWARKNG